MLLTAKAFIFIVSLLTPNGPLPPRSEPMESLEACMAKVAEAHKDFAEINENFTFIAGCAQVSAKNTPA